MQKKLLLASVTLAIFASNTAIADEFDDASNAMCEHVKACAMQEIDMSSIPPEMVPMVTQSLNNMCQQVRTANPYTQNMRKGHPMYQHATACMNSITKLSCEDIMEDDRQTPECKKAEQEAEKYPDQD